MTSTAANMKVSLEEAALSVVLVVYIHGITDRKTYEHFKVRKIIKSKRVSALLKEAPANDPSGQSTNHDTLADEEYARALWVGMRPSNAVELQKMQSTRGSCGTNNKKCTVVKHDPKALRVVSPLTGMIANYYSLVAVDGTDDLFDAYLTPVEEVFFFQEYRDDSLTVRDDRRHASGRLIRQALVDVNAERTGAGDDNKLMPATNRKRKRDNENEVSPQATTSNASDLRILLEEAIELCNKVDTRGADEANVINKVKENLSKVIYDLKGDEVDTKGVQNDEGDDIKAVQSDGRDDIKPNASNKQDGNGEGEERD